MLDLSSTIDLCKLLGDPTRLRLLRLLADEELTVAELVQVTQLPQPRVSTHLGRLREASLVRDRRDGGSSHYRLAREGRQGVAGKLLSAALEGAEDPLLAADAVRLEQVLSARRGGSWAEGVAGAMSRHYSPGRTWPALTFGVIGLARFGRVLDVGSGDGSVARFLAPRAEHITCLDISPKVVAKGRALSERFGNVGFVEGDMHAMPFDAASFEHVLVMAALAHSEEPARVLAEAARVLAPGGSLVVVALEAHPHKDLVGRFDHVNLGFSSEELRGHAEAAGLVVESCRSAIRERRPPHFDTLVLTAHRPASTSSPSSSSPRSP